MLSEVSDGLALGGGDLTPRAPRGRKKVVEEEGTEDGIVEADVEDGDVDKPQEQDEEEAATEAPASSDKADS